MDATDLRRGFLAALSALKPAELSDEQALDVFRRRMRSRVRTYVGLMDDRVAGTASLFIEMNTKAPRRLIRRRISRARH